MAGSTTVLDDAVIALRGTDFSGQSNSGTLSIGRNTENSNAFGDKTEVQEATLKTLSGSVSGFFQTDPQNTELDALMVGGNITSANMGISHDAALGSTAWMLVANLTGNEDGAAHGELLKFGFDFSNGGEFAKRGVLAENGSFSSTGPGTAHNLGQVSANQTLYAQMHVVAVSGGTPSLDASIESDVDTTFTDADETERITFSNFKVTGSERLTASGAITDTYYAFNVKAIRGTFTVIVFLAIQ